MTRFWVGGYGSRHGGSADGIGLLLGDTGRESNTLAFRGVAADASSPSWLAQHPTLGVIYAALEGDGAVQAFVLSGERVLRPLGDPVPAGPEVCHLAVSPSGLSLLASCYGDGRVVRIGLDIDGRPLPHADDRAAALRAALLGEQVEQSVSAGAAVPARDPHASSAPQAEAPDRGERISRSHAAVFLPDGRAATTDIGFDLVRVWRASRDGLGLSHEVVLPRGTGPRHLVVHPSGHVHVVTEYSNEIFTLAPGPDGTFAIVAATSVSPVAQDGIDFAAELACSRDGQFLYTALRGSNTIAALRVRGSGERLDPVALADSGVDWPRHHLLHEGKLLVAGQRSDSVALLDIDERTGAPLGVRHETQVPTPTHLLLMR